MQNDTYGEITRQDLADLRAHAKSCGSCGMLATVDPASHTSRYGHVPTFKDDRGTWTWNPGGHRWDIAGGTPRQMEEQRRIEEQRQAQ